MTSAGDLPKALNVIVCIKYAVDPNQLETEPVTGKPNLARAPCRINNFDENAIEEALRLKAKHGGKLVGVSLVSQAPPKDVLLRALAMGVDISYLVTLPGQSRPDAYVSAVILAAAIREVAERSGIAEWDLVLCGEASVDEYSGQTGPRIAEALDIPSITYVKSLSVNEGTLRAVRVAEDREETVEVSLPVVVTVGMEASRPRLPTVLQIMGAGRKPTVEMSAADLCPHLVGMETASVVKTLDVSAPSTVRRREVLSGETPDAMAREVLRRLIEQGDVWFR